MQIPQKLFETSRAVTKIAYHEVKIEQLDAQQESSCFKALRNYTE